MAEKKEIAVGGSAIGPYSPALEVGDRLYVSGQIALDFDTGAMHNESIAQETEQVMTNISRVLSKAGYSCADIIKSTIYVTSIEDFLTVNEIYARYLTKPYPARATVAVAALPKDARVEIEVVAER